MIHLRALLRIHGEKMTGVYDGDIFGSLPFSDGQNITLTLSMHRVFRYLSVLQALSVALHSKWKINNYNREGTKISYKQNHSLRELIAGQPFLIQANEGGASYVPRNRFSYVLAMY